jgi:hypothetical protein
MAIDHPRVVPPLHNPGPSKLVPTIHQKFWLTTWLVSGNPSKQIAYRNKHVPCFWCLGGKTPIRTINQPGKYGVAGVIYKPLNSPLNFLLGILAHQLQQGKSYRSLNVYRSAISSTFPQINSVSVGQHPLTVRLMKGAFHLRPAPRLRGQYTKLSFLRNLGASADLSLKWLSWKLVIVMALALACRCSELQMIEVPGITFNEQGVVIICKASRKLLLLIHQSGLRLSG